MKHDSVGDRRAFGDRFEPDELIPVWSEAIMLEALAEYHGYDQEDLAIFADECGLNILSLAWLMTNCITPPDAPYRAM
jgi:hypothetical protein